MIPDVFQMKLNYLTPLLLYLSIKYALRSPNLGQKHICSILNPLTPTENFSFQISFKHLHLFLMKKNKSEYTIYLETNH